MNYLKIGLTVWLAYLAFIVIVGLCVEWKKWNKREKQLEAQGWEGDLKKLDNSLDVWG